MKNLIPLILAVILGLAAVLAVGRLIRSQDVEEDMIVSVVSAARDIGTGTEISEDMILQKDVPVEAEPRQSIRWSRRDLVLGQKTLRPVLQSDYLLFGDVGFTRSLSSIVGEGEWAVALPLGTSGVGRMVQPGDEVAVIGHFQVSRRVESADLAAPSEFIEEEVTTVLYPRVRVLDVGEAGGGAGSIIVALAPPQAQVLLAALRKGELEVALRRPDDPSRLSRVDGGYVSDETISNLLGGIERVVVPFEAE